MNIQLALGDADYIEKVPMKHWDMNFFGENGLEHFACETIGCVAGHIAAKNYDDYLKYLGDNQFHLKDSGFYVLGVEYTTKRLQLSNIQARILFYEGLQMMPREKANQLRQMVFDELTEKFQTNLDEWTVDDVDLMEYAYKKMNAKKR